MSDVRVVVGCILAAVGAFSKHVYFVVDRSDSSKSAHSTPCVQALLHVDMAGTPRTVYTYTLYSHFRCANKLRFSVRE